MEQRLAINRKGAELMTTPHDDALAKRCAEALILNFSGNEMTKDAMAATLAPILAAAPGAGPLLDTGYIDPEFLGRMVRDEWVMWAHTQPNPKESWLKPWDKLSEPDKEVDRRIGERLFRFAELGIAKLRNAPASNGVAAPAVDAARMEEALEDLVAVIESAGLLNLSNGVQLGQTSWYVKAHERLEWAKATLHSPAILTAAVNKDAAPEPCSREGDATFDPDEPTCPKCHQIMTLLPGCEWSDNPAENLCNNYKVVPAGDAAGGERDALFKLIIDTDLSGDRGETKGIFASRVADAILAAGWRRDTEKNLREAFNTSEHMRAAAESEVARLNAHIEMMREVAIVRESDVRSLEKKLGYAEQSIYALETEVARLKAEVERSINFGIGLQSVCDYLRPKLKAAEQAVTALCSRKHLFPETAATDIRLEQV